MSSTIRRVRIYPHRAVMPIERVVFTLGSGGARRGYIPALQGEFCYRAKSMTHVCSALPAGASRQEIIEPEGQWVTGHNQDTADHRVCP